jgi:hypothetical protein
MNSRNQIHTQSVASESAQMTYHVNSKLDTGRKNLDISFTGLLEILNARIPSPPDPALESLAEPCECGSWE